MTEIKIIDFATISSKGQVTIPKQIRDDLGLEKGGRIVFVRIDDRIVIMRDSDLNISGIK